LSWTNFDKTTLKYVIKYGVPFVHHRLLGNDYFLGYERWCSPLLALAGYSGYHYGCSLHVLEKAIVLLKWGLEISSLDSLGNTVLHRVLCCTRIATGRRGLRPYEEPGELLKVFIAAGADVYALNNAGCSASRTARNYGREKEWSKALESCGFDSKEVVKQTMPRHEQYTGPRQTTKLTFEDYLRTWDEEEWEEKMSRFEEFDSEEEKEKKEEKEFDYSGYEYDSDEEYDSDNRYNIEDDDDDDEEEDDDDEDDDEEDDDEEDDDEEDDDDEEKYENRPGYERPCYCDQQPPAMASKTLNDDDDDDDESSSIAGTIHSHHHLGHEYQGDGTGEDMVMDSPAHRSTAVDPTDMFERVHEDEGSVGMPVGHLHGGFESEHLAGHDDRLLRPEDCLSQIDPAGTFEGLNHDGINNLGAPIWYHDPLLNDEAESTTGSWRYGAIDPRRTLEEGSMVSGNFEMDVTFDNDFQTDFDTFMACEEGAFQ
jgi:hypothetical protein